MSEVRTNALSDAAGTGPTTLTRQVAAKVWAQFDHTTPALDDDFNVSSFTDIAAGDFIINFTNNMSSATYPVTGSNIGSTTVVMPDTHHISSFGTDKTASVFSASFFSKDVNNWVDQDNGQIVVLGDLA